MKPNQMILAFKKLANYITKKADAGATLVVNGANRLVRAPRAKQAGALAVGVGVVAASAFGGAVLPHDANHGGKDSASVNPADLGIIWESSTLKMIDNALNHVIPVAGAAENQVILDKNSTASSFSNVNVVVQGDPVYGECSPKRSLSFNKCNIYIPTYQMLVAEGSEKITAVNSTFIIDDRASICLLGNASLTGNGCYVVTKGPYSSIAAQDNASVILLNGLAVGPGTVGLVEKASFTHRKDSVYGTLTGIKQTNYSQNWNGFNVNWNVPVSSLSQKLPPKEVPSELPTRSNTTTSSQTIVSSLKV